MQIIESGIRYYIVDISGVVYYTGHGEWSTDFNLRYFWYVNPEWMLDNRNPHALDECEIVAEHYATD